jgi:hypothetical protein
MEETISTTGPAPEEPIYSSRAIMAGAFWAGPIVAGYMLTRNFKVFGEQARANRALIFSILGTVLVLAITAAPFFDRVPFVVFPLIYAWIFHFVVRATMGEKIEAHFGHGGARVSIGKIILVGVIGAIPTLILAFGIGFLYTAAFDDTVTKTFGTLKHEVQYQKRNITEEEVDRIGKALTDAGYFDSEQQKFVDIKKDNEKYEFFLYCNESIKNDPGVYGPYTGLRYDIQKQFPANKIIFNLVIGTPDNVVKRFE